MSQHVPTSLRDVLKSRWASAQQHEASFWKAPGALDSQFQRVAARYEAVVRGVAGNAGAGGWVLEVGSGPTCSVRTLRGPRKVYLDPLMVTYRPLLPPEVAGDFVCAMGEDLPFEDGQFDFVFSFNVIDHVLSPGRFVSELRRVAKPGGKVVLGVYTHPRLFAAVRTAIERGLPRLREVPHPFFFSRESLVRLVESQGLRLEELVQAYAAAKQPSLHRQDWVAVTTA